MVDARVSNTLTSRCVGSSPTTRTTGGMHHVERPAGAVADISMQERKAPLESTANLVWLPLPVTFDSACLCLVNGLLSDAIADPSDNWIGIRNKCCQGKDHRKAIFAFGSFGQACSRIENNLTIPNLQNVDKWQALLEKISIGGL